ncbi:DNA-processing protein DprA [Neoactinobaculum massilliense]|uniref:DNA-processing protein DprA n=1 Tax=Neoactinobaculum massilliense TaxID=2364794 RepID=UPI000F52080F|nr:DNA-processing protein DprA [Neoactinobaculum massilliense]
MTSTSREISEEERRAAMIWTAIAEGEDTYAVAATRAVTSAGALRGIKERTGELPGVDTTGSQRALARWRNRLDGISTAAMDHFLMGADTGFLHPGEFPPGLGRLDGTMPLGLWYRGNVAALDAPCGVLVGSRAATAYGTRVALDFAYAAAERGMSVVSGGAVGIDAAAHTGALRAGGRTIAVMACGLDRPYPASNRGLFKEILDSGGLLLSESPPGAAPHRHRFLARNRIIAALGAGVAVVEAAYRSGALSTAHHALERGINLGAVPGPITAPHSAGCLRLLREGAICLSSSEDFIELLGVPRSDTSPAQLALSLSDPMAGDVLAVRVRDALPAVRPAAAGRIATTAGLSPQETLVGLGRLEMAGIAEQQAGDWRLVRHS